jgi:hypothetical protein
VVSKRNGFIACGMGTLNKLRRNKLPVAQECMSMQINHNTVTYRKFDTNVKVINNIIGNLYVTILLTADPAVKKGLQNSIKVVSFHTFE